MCFLILRPLSFAAFVLALMLLAPGCDSRKNEHETDDDPTHRPVKEMDGLGADRRVGEDHEAIWEEVATYWGCVSHHDIRLVKQGICPVCLDSLRFMEQILTYGGSTTYSCPLHGSQPLNSNGTCPTCDRALKKLIDISLLEESDPRIIENDDSLP